MVDLSDENYLAAFDLLKKELEQYAPELLERPRLLVGTKLDLYEADQALEKLSQAFLQQTVCGISTFTRKGLDEFIKLTAGRVLGTE